MNKVAAFKSLVLASLLGSAGIFGVAHAESNFQTGAPGTALTATARVDFQITIPKVLYLQVGTGTPLTNVATVDLIQFSVPAANVGDSTVISGTGGNLTNGVVTAIVRGNYGDITLKATTVGALNNGTATETIDWSQITTTAAANTTGTVLTAPTLANGVSGVVTLTAVNKVVNQDAKWTYKYANANIVAAGTYGGVNTNNGRVTYTAVLP